MPPRPNGRRRRKSHTLRGPLSEAKAERAQLLADTSRGNYVGRTQQTLKVVARLQRGTVADRTWERYDAIWVQPGEPERPSTISRTFRHRVEKVGQPGVNFHALRHAHATMLLRQGLAAHLVSRRFGHSDAAITLRVYAGVLPGQEKAIVDAFAMALSPAGIAR